MIFCYAWSNLLLINMVNVKVNNYPDEKADLIIKSSPTIDMTLVKSIINMNVFENVYFDDYVSFRPKKKKMRWHELRKKYSKHYDRFISSLDCEGKYDKVLVAGFWNDVLYMLKALMKKGNNFSVDFVEEGEISYEESWKLYRPYIGTSRGMQLFHKFSTWGVKRKCSKKLSRKMYLYSPERQNDKELLPVAMMKIVPTNPVYKLFNSLYNGLSESHRIYYSKRRAVFLSNFLMPNMYEDSYQYAYGLINAVIECVGDNNTIIKPHVSQTKHRLEFAKEYEAKSNVFVDRDVYIFESLFCDEKIDDKILIAKTSSILIHPVAMFGKEPYIFLLYKLYPWYKNYGDDVADEYAESLRNLYSNPEKINVPNSMLEFKMQLESVHLEISRLK